MTDYMCPADPTVTHCYHAAKVNELIAERDAEIERLRAALERIAKWRGDDLVTDGRVIQMENIARAALDGQPERKELLEEIKR